MCVFGDNSRYDNDTNVFFHRQNLLCLLNPVHFTEQKYLINFSRYHRLFTNKKSTGESCRFTLPAKEPLVKNYDVIICMTYCHFAMHVLRFLAIYPGMTMIQTYSFHHQNRHFVRLEMKKSFAIWR